MGVGHGYSVKDFLLWWNCSFAGVCKCSVPNTFCGDFRQLNLTLEQVLLFL